MLVRATRARRRAAALAPPCISHAGEIVPPHVWHSFHSVSLTFPSTLSSALGESRFRKDRAISKVSLRVPRV